MTKQRNREPFGLVYKLTRNKLCTEAAVSNIQTQNDYTMDFNSTVSTLLNASFPDNKPKVDIPEQELVRHEVADDPPTEEKPVFNGKEVGDIISCLKNSK